MYESEMFDKGVDERDGQLISTQWNKDEKKALSEFKKLKKSLQCVVDTCLFESDETPNMMDFIILFVIS